QRRARCRIARCGRLRRSQAHSLARIALDVRLPRVEALPVGFQILADLLGRLQVQRGRLIDQRRIPLVCVARHVVRLPLGDGTPFLVVVTLVIEPCHFPISLRALRPCSESYRPKFLLSTPCASYFFVPCCGRQSTGDRSENTIRRRIEGVEEEADRHDPIEPEGCPKS